jgi:hypothetical protein
MNDLIEKTKLLNHLYQFMLEGENTSPEAILLAIEELEEVTDVSQIDASFLKVAKKYLSYQIKDKQLEMFSLLPAEYVPFYQTDVSGKLVNQDAIIPEKEDIPWQGISGFKNYSYNWPPTKLYVSTYSTIKDNKGKEHRLLSIVVPTSHSPYSNIECTLDGEVNIVPPQYKYYDDKKTKRTVLPVALSVEGSKHYTGKRTQVDGVEFAILNLNQHIDIRVLS